MDMAELAELGALAACLDLCRTRLPFHVAFAHHVAVERIVVLNVVGLSSSVVGSHTPQIPGFAQRGVDATIMPAFPAVTCTAQSNYLTGRSPFIHGIVGNGWYNRELAEVHFWKQSNHLVQARKIWDELRAANPQFTCAQ